VKEKQVNFLLTSFYLNFVVSRQLLQYIFIKENGWYLYFLVCLNFFIFGWDRIIGKVRVFLWRWYWKNSNFARKYPAILKKNIAVHTHEKGVSTRLSS
jgi:uncharacterized membrane-anchored protein YitT (DUF2179 family)